VALQCGEPLGAAEDDDDDPTAFVVATSGSTGLPKGALLPVSALHASGAATQQRLGGPGRWLLALPAHHIAGLQVLLRCAAAGVPPDVLDTAEPFTAARFVDAVAAMAAPTGEFRRRYVSLVPTQLHRILAEPEAVEAARTFDAVLVGGAAAAPTLLDRATTAGITVVTSYGMSETCGGCVYDGRALDGITVSTDEDGRIALSGPVVARGYRGRPGDPAFPTPGTFRTDDWGTVTGGRLTVLGRRDDLIMTGGVKIAPSVVEARLATMPGVAQAVVVGVPDPHWGEAVAALITVTGRPPDIEATRAAVADLSAAHRPRHLVVVDELPLIGPGKPDRAAARRIAMAALQSEDRA
jgi:O-succinylbenzoic acid--CoA ligase